MKNTTTHSARPEKKKAKKWPWIVGVIATLGIVGSCSTAEDAPEDTTASTATVVSEASPEASDPVAQDSVASETVESEESAPLGDVPREYTNALKSAERYLKFSHFSYQGLFDQLTSEFGEGFAPEAAQYAMDNVEADWNAEAVEAAESYLEFSPMSSSELYDQLVSEYGEAFTPEEAEYAVSLVY